MTEFEQVPATQAKRRKPAAPAEHARYVARKKLTIGQRVFKPGDPVPEAESWPRVESWVRSGFLEEAS